MDIKTNRLFLLIIACSATGVVLGGASSWVDSHQCLQGNNITTQCLTQDPMLNTIQGMSLGLVAGAGAAIGATWQINQED